MNIKAKDKESDMPCLLEAALMCREKQYPKAISLLKVRVLVLLLLLPKWYWGAARVCN